MRERMGLDEIEAELRRRGVPPLAGGDGDPDPDPAPDPAAGGDPDPDPQQPTAEEQLAEERVRAARLEGENAALRSRPAPAGTPAAKRPEDLTLEELEQAATAIENDASLTPAQQMRGLARVEALKLDRQRRDREVLERPRLKAEAKLAEYVGKYPELNQGGSELLGKVSVEVRALAADYGMDPDDPRTQLVAVERVVGGHKLGGGVEGGREFARRKIPVAGAGAGAGEGGGGGGKPDPLKDIPKWQVEHWTRLGYSRDEMVEEAKYFTPHRRGVPA